jgi:hypothetical protein
VAGRLNNRAEELWVGGQRSGLDRKVVVSGMLESGNMGARLER